MFLIVVNVGINGAGAPCYNISLNFNLPTDFTVSSANKKKERAVPSCLAGYFQEEFSATVRLKTGAPGWLSGSTQK